MVFVQINMKTCSIRVCAPSYESSLDMQSFIWKLIGCVQIHMKTTEYVDIHTKAPRTSSFQCESS